MVNSNVDVVVTGSDEEDESLIGNITHVGTPFEDEPFRIIEVAKYAALGLEVDSETIQMMKASASSLRSTPNKLLGSELVNVFKESNIPRKFFDVLSEVNALSVVYPEVAGLQFVPAGPEKYHKEGDAYEHTMRVLMSAYNQRGNDVTALLSALSHDLGKAATSPDILPNHYGHAKLGSNIADDFFTRYNLPKEYDGVMSTAARTHMQLGKFENVNKSTVLDYSKMVYDSPISINQIVALGAADAAGRVPQGDFNKSTTKTYLETAISVLENVDEATAIQNRGYDDGENISEDKLNNMVRQDRVESLQFQLD